MNNVYVITTRKMVISDNIECMNQVMETMSENDAELGARTVECDVQQVLSDLHYTACCKLVESFIELGMDSKDRIRNFRMFVMSMLKVRMDTDTMDTLYYQIECSID